MHELSYVTQLILTLEDYALKNDISSILSVSITVGEGTMVVPRYLTECYDIAKKDSEPLKESKLILNMIPIKVKCRQCKKESIADNNTTRICPICGSNVEVIQGYEFEIDEISI